MKHWIRPRRTLVGLWALCLLWHILDPALWLPGARMATSCVLCMLSIGILYGIGKKHGPDWVVFCLLVYTVVFTVLGIWVPCVPGLFHVGQLWLPGPSGLMDHIQLYGMLLSWERNWVLVLLVTFLVLRRAAHKNNSKD